MRLRAEVGPATFSKNVLVTFGHANDGTQFNEVWSIHWIPENGGPFPEFNGLLALRYTSGGPAELEISGEYLPPLGAFGKGFDLVLGQRIASQTCRNLLAEIAGRIEQACAV